MSAAVPDSIRRVVYLGTPQYAVPPLQALHDAGCEIAAVVSQPDTRRGRGNAVSPSPVKAAAQSLGLPTADDLAALEGIEADLGVVVAYGRKIPERLLERLAFVNLHFSLLPRWRGPAPLERAILAGDATTGVCLMAVAPELDSGGVYARSETAIGAEETLAELRDRLTGIGTALLLDALVDGFGVPEPQQGEPTHAAKVSADERRLRWDQSAEAVHRQVRAGGAFTSFRGRRLAVHRSAVAPGSADEAGDIGLEPGQLRGTLVGTGDGLIELLEVQPEGKARRSGAAWLNGARPGTDDRLGR